MLIIATSACSGNDTIFSNPVHLQTLLIATGSDGDVRLYGAGFGDSTLRGWSVSDTLALDQVLWLGEGSEPVNVGTVGPTVTSGLSGVWGLTQTSSGAIVAGGKLSGTALLMSAESGPLRVASSVTQGSLVESINPAVGLTPARGLDRIGPVASESDWLYTAGLDGLGIYMTQDGTLDYVGFASDLAGADDLLIASTATHTPSGTGRVILSRCRRRVIDAACLSPTEEAELIVARRSASGRISVDSRWAYDADAIDGRQTLVGDGHLAAAYTTADSPVLLAAFEGSATIVGLRLSPQGTLTSTGSKQVIAPWQDATALPAFDSAVVSTSTLAPLRIGQVAVVAQTVFVAVRSGGFVAHFPLGCLSAAIDAEECQAFTCLDEVGGCAGPSEASETPTYPYAIAASDSRVYVGVDVRSLDGTITSRIAILEVDEAGAVSLVGYIDA